MNAFLTCDGFLQGEFIVNWMLDGSGSVLEAYNILDILQSIFEQSQQLILIPVVCTILQRGFLYNLLSQHEAV